MTPCCYIARYYERKYHVRLRVITDLCSVSWGGRGGGAKQNRSLPCMLINSTLLCKKFAYAPDARAIFPPRRTCHISTQWDLIFEYWGTKLCRSILYIYFVSPPQCFYEPQLQIIAMLFSTLLFKKIAREPGGQKNLCLLSWGEQNRSHIFTMIYCEMACAL